MQLVNCSFNPSDGARHYARLRNGATRLARSHIILSAGLLSTNGRSEVESTIWIRSEESTTHSRAPAQRPRYVRSGSRIRPVQSTGGERSTLIGRQTPGVSCHFPRARCNLAWRSSQIVPTTQRAPRRGAGCDVTSVTCASHKVDTTSQTPACKCSLQRLLRSQQPPPPGVS